MPKLKKRYVCQLCGSVSPRWAGQCADCGEWNSLVEDAAGVVTPFSARHDLRGGGRRIELVGRARIPDGRPVLDEDQALLIGQVGELLEPAGWNAVVSTSTTWRMTEAADADVRTGH